MATDKPGRFQLNELIPEAETGLKYKYIVQGAKYNNLLDKFQLLKLWKGLNQRKY